MIEFPVRFFRGHTLPAGALSLIAGVFVCSTATFMAMPMIAVFLASERGMGAGPISIVLGVYFVAEHVSPLLFGAWSDRMSRYRFVFWGLVTRAAGFLGVAYADTLIAITVFATLLGLGGSAFVTAAFGLFAGLDNGKRERAVVYANVGQNAGVFLGPLVGALAAWWDPVLPFIISGLVFLLIAGGGLCTPRLPDVRSPVNLLRGIFQPLLNRRFLLLMGVMLPWFAIFPQLYVVMPLAAAELGGDNSWANTVFAVNGAVGVVMLVVLGRMLQRGEPMRMIALCYATAAISFVVALGSGDIVLLLGAITLFSIAEVVMLPAAEVVVVQEAPPEQGGSFFGVFTAIFGIGAAGGQAVGTYLALELSLAAAWKMMITVSSAGFVVTIVALLAGSRRPAPMPTKLSRGAFQACDE